jgi:hypothetical protein
MPLVVSKKEKCCLGLRLSGRPVQCSECREYESVEGLKRAYSELLERITSYI